MQIVKKLIRICFQDKLKKIFKNDEVIVSSILENFFISFKKFNNYLKLLIIIFLLLIIFLNFIFIFFYLFKFKINFFSEALNFISRIPYLKNINNFIMAHLLLHFE